MAASTLSSEQLQLLILERLDEAPIKDTRELQLDNGSMVGPVNREQLAIKAALDSLTVRQMVLYSPKHSETAVLTPEAEQMAREGSHEFRVWAALEREQDVKYLQEKLGKEIATAGQLNAFKRKWIGRHGDGLVRVS